jgi:hypothetical protein
MRVSEPKCWTMRISESYVWSEVCVAYFHPPSKSPAGPSSETRRLTPVNTSWFLPGTWAPCYWSPDLPDIRSAAVLWSEQLSIHVWRVQMSSDSGLSAQTLMDTFAKPWSKHPHPVQSIPRHIYAIYSLVHSTLALHSQSSTLGRILLNMIDVHDQDPFCLHLYIRRDGSCAIYFQPYTYFCHIHFSLRLLIISCKCTRW